MQRSQLLFCTLLFLFILTGGFVAAKDHLRAKVRTDTSEIKLRQFNDQAIQKLKKEKAFNYNGEATVAGESLWDRFWSWVWQKIGRLFSGIPYGGVIFEYALLALGVAFLIYVVFKSIGIDIVKLWQGNAKKVSLLYTESLENIHEINFDEEIEKAIAQHNYRFAVRLLYLKSLKQLSDNNLIQWQIDKTNAAYIYELADAVQKQSFGLLTRQFEYVWYGDFAIDKQAFGNIHQLFQDFKNQLS